MVSADQRAEAAAALARATAGAPRESDFRRRYRGWLSNKGLPQTYRDMTSASAEVEACRQLQGRHRLRLELAAPAMTRCSKPCRPSGVARCQPLRGQCARVLTALQPRWRRPVAPEGVLFQVLPEPRNVSPCSQRLDARSTRTPTVATERTNRCPCWSRRHSRRSCSGGMVPVLPIALSTSQSTAAFVRSRPELRGLWDPIVELDEAALLRTRHLAALSARHPFLWKLAALLLTPFERTLFLDADLLVLSPTLVSNALRNSLRIHEIAMPVDINRPGNLDDGVAACAAAAGVARSRAVRARRAY